METILIFTFAALAIIFLVLWLIRYTSGESYSQLTKEVRGMNETLNCLVGKMSALQEATEKKEKVKGLPEIDPFEPLSIESVRTALRYNGILPDNQDPDEPEVLFFAFNGRHYRVCLGGLPFVTIQLVFRLNEKEERNIELMKEAALDVSLRAYGACVHVVPEKQYFLIEADIYADTYLYLRNNIRFYAGLVENTASFFYDHFEDLQKERKQYSQEAINHALIAAQNDLAGKKLSS